MGEFRKADITVHEVFMDMIDKHFSNLSGYSFGLLFRDKIKKSRGNIILASITIPTKLMSFFARNDNDQPYDFLIIVDEMAWACGTEEDRVRIIRHEMRHCFLNDKGRAMLIDHDFADFHEEVKLNLDNPGWASDLAVKVQAAYGQLKDGGKDPRVDNRDAKDLESVDKDPQRQTVMDFSEKVGKDVADKVMSLDEALSVADSVSMDIEHNLPLDEMARKRGLLPAGA